MNDALNMAASSQKRALDTPYQENHPSKVQKQDTGNKNCDPRQPSNRVQARATNQALPSRRLVFSHVELPTRLRHAEKPSTVTPLLPESYGPPIGTVSAFISRCNRQSRATANGQCQVLSFFGIFCFQQMVICTLHGYAFHVIPLSLLARHLNRDHKFCVHRGQKDNSDTTMKRTREVILHEIVQHVSECCALSLLQTPKDIGGHLDVKELLLPPSDLNTATHRSTTYSKEPKKRLIQAEQRFLCPCSSCDRLIPLNHGKGSDRSELVRHVKEFHQADTKLLTTARNGCVTVRWTQRIYIATEGTDTSFTYLLLPPDWRPSDSVSSDMSSILSRPKFIDTAWTKQIKWDSYRTGLGRFSPGKLSELIATPALKLVPTEPGEHRAIELGLYHLKKTALAYLLQFHDMVTTIPELRELVASK